MHPVFIKHNYQVDQKVLKKFEKRMKIKNMKIKRKKYELYHKSSKSLSKNELISKEIISKKRKYSSPKKGRPKTSHVQSNQHLDKNFPENDEIIYYRHSERRNSNVCSIYNKKIILFKIIYFC